MFPKTKIHSSIDQHKLHKGVVEVVAERRNVPPEDSK